jgi:hypothetical protein
MHNISNISGRIEVEAACPCRAMAQTMAKRGQHLGVAKNLILAGRSGSNDHRISGIMIHSLLPFSIPVVATIGQTPNPLQHQIHRLESHPIVI